MNGWKFCLLTFGCKVNQYETQSLREAWQGFGGQETEDPASADVILLNTCAITANAVADARQAVYRLHRDAPTARLIVTGCAADVHRLSQSEGAHAERNDFSALSGVFCVVGQQNKARLLTVSPLTLTPPASNNACAPDALPSGQVREHAGEQRHDAVQAPSKALAHDPLYSLEKAIQSKPEAGSPVVQAGRVFPPFHIHSFRRARPVLKVQDGCSHGCAYCIVPLTRGAARSRSPQECLAEVRRLLDAGHREIMLSGINLRQYSAREAGCADFWDLVRFLDQALAPEWADSPDPLRFRISSLDPAQLTEKGLNCLSSARLLCPQLHLSLQSGSPAVLHGMRRGHYQPERLVEQVTQLVQSTPRWSRFGLGADILMGFPTETEEHVLETLAIVEALPLTYAHVFPYSERPGTVAATMPHVVPKAERQARAARVRALVEAKQQAFWEASLNAPELLVALDCNESSGDQPQQGVDACYVPCRLTTPLQGEGHGLVAVRPVALERRGLLVTPL